MTEPTKIPSFPAHKLPEAREALAKLHARLTRASIKAGEVAPEAPVLTVAAERVVSICNECKIHADGFIGGTCLACGDGYMTAHHVLDLELVAPKPALAGWEFLAVVEPLEGGNLIRTVPGADTDGVDFSPWHTGDIRCDHCKTVRKRTETFLVRKLDASPEVVAANVKAPNPVPAVAKTMPTRDCPDCGRRCARVGGSRTCPDDLAAARYEEAAYGKD